jgi:hypothetical protein
MRIWTFAALSALALLAGCGGSDAEDFTVAVKRPVAVVYAPLLAADVSEARIVFPGATFERSRPRDGEILYTIPGTGSFPATVLLRLEPQNNGETTLVHATVKVPEIHARIDGQEKVLSERRIERHLEGLLKSTGRSLEMGSSASAETMQLSSLLLALAVITDKKQLARALDLKSNPSKLTELLLAFGGPDEQPAPDVNGREIRTVNPDAAENQREMAQANAEWGQEEAQDKAAAPTSNLERFDN